MGIKNKKLTKGDLVTCKQRHRLHLRHHHVHDPFAALERKLAKYRRDVHRLASGAQSDAPRVSRGSLGIVKFASDERIVIHWFDLNKDGEMSPTDARKRLSKISRPKK